MCQALLGSGDEEIEKTKTLTSRSLHSGEVGGFTK